MSMYQLLPPLSNEEYAALRTDIEASGIRVPIDVDEDGQILDGHHRQRIAYELGIDCPRRIVAGLDEVKKREHALMVNVQRRHLTQQQKRELIAASLKADVALADREHARRTGASHPTVAKVRAELEQAGDVEKVSTRTDLTGRQQPATKPASPSLAEAIEHANALVAVAEGIHCPAPSDIDWPPPEPADTDWPPPVDPLKAEEMARLAGRQEALNAWTEACDGLTRALSYAKTYTPPADIPANYLPTSAFLQRVDALREVANSWSATG